MFSTGYGFVVDYLAEILRYMRNEDFSNRYEDKFTLSSDISTRDRDGINKTFSGLMKLLFPSGDATEAEVEELLVLAIEGRKRVKDQLMRIDTTYPEVDFSIIRNSGDKVTITTLEETEFPAYYHKRLMREDSGSDDAMAPLENENSTAEKTGNTAQQLLQPTECHRVFSENQKGISFEELFWPWLSEAKSIIVTDPYIRLFHQVRNIMELVELVASKKAPGDEVEIHLITTHDEYHLDKQQEKLSAVREAASRAGIKFDWEFDGTGTIHARHIITDTGWKISLDRGLDIFQKFEMNDTFDIANRLQKFRSVKAFEVTYMRS
jgi:ATP-dependent Lon protease